MKTKAEEFKEAIDNNEAQKALELISKGDIVNSSILYTRIRWC